MSLEGGLERTPKAEGVRPGKLEKKRVGKYPVVPACHLQGWVHVEQTAMWLTSAKYPLAGAVLGARGQTGGDS